ncbi:MAG: VanZ family protein [Rariglobus sp.]|nr:VanZ family protein [Rariglobus sp.]
MPAARRPAGHWLWAVAVAGTVFLASGQSHVAAPGIVNFDKIAHALVFGLIATLVGRSFHRRRWVWFAILLTSSYGAIDEIRQSFTVGRSVEVADWVADTVGAVLAVSLYQLWAWYRHLLEMPLFRRKPQVEKSPAPMPTEGEP